MKDVLCHEWLFFCSREDLEPLQLVRKSLRKMIVARSSALPLRSIHRVSVDCCHEPPIPNYPDKIEIFVKEDRYPEEMTPEEAVKRYYKTSVCDNGDFAGAVRRLQHSCIKNFDVDIGDSPFLRYWMAQEADAFTVLSICINPPEATKNYELLDAIVNRVRPNTLDVSYESGPSAYGDQTAPYNSEYLEVMARDSFLNILQICPLNIWPGAFPPPSFILDEPGYPNYELRCHRSTVDGIYARSWIADGIDAFLESFVRDGCANKKLISMCITWTEWPNAEPPCPMPKLLSNPTMADEPLPEAEADAERLKSNNRWIRGVRVLSQCEMHTFVNMKHQKRMEVRKWNVKHFVHEAEEDHFGHSTTHILQCLVKSV
ncbi:hypothetical protein AAVH_27850 [Aphelenchoides avenae]|nr:hypothetical protein AAVH_27850 [Aphelenchus avenae]